MTRKVFTTGEVAALCKVAPRTVAKWFDSGRLKGYRIPGSQDRRVPREQLVKFLGEHGMPLPDELDEAAAAAHTAGPWTYHATAGDHGQWLVYPEDDEAGRDVCVVYHGEGNARLIAAAPELLAELEKLVERIERANGWDQRDDGLSGARAAIAKAK